MNVHVTFRVPPLRGLRRVPLPRAEGAITLLRDRVGAEFMDRAPRLRVIAQMAVGTENIDVREATRRGIIVTNTPNVLTESTADLAFALILACARGIVRWDRHVREGRFAGWEPFGYLGHDVHGARLAIVGKGRIGKAVARRARGFDMRVHFVTRRSDLRAAIRDADFVSLHCPLAPETRHLIGRRELRAMKRSAVLINTARGPIVDEEALVRALRQGWIAGAGLDVYEHEPRIHRGLLGLDNVVLLPHIGSATAATRWAMLERAVENLRAVLGGRRPLDAVR
jgi:glyoxylate reductase